MFKDEKRNKYLAIILSLITVLLSILIYFLR